MKFGEYLSSTISNFEAAGIDSARLDTLILLETATKRDRSYILSHEEDELSKDQLTLLNQMAKLRINRNPVAYILGRKEFYGLDFVVNQNVLVPRAETEAIVEFVIKNAPKDSLMHDVGTGSGAIAISVKSNRLDMKVSGSDISSDALKIARLNSKNMKIDVDFMVSDLLESVDGKFDVITANLPYIPRGRKLANEVLVEPTIAIFGGIDGLKLYKKLFSQIPTHINPKAQLIIEHEPQQMHQIKLLSRRSDAKKMQEISNYVSVIRF